MKNRILYLRNFANIVDVKTYNLQEIGLCKELVRKGHNCDIVYFSNENVTRIETIYSYKEFKLRLLWVPSIKIFNNSVFLSVLNKKFLSHYSVVISTEYNQVMTYLIGKMKPKNVKLFLYHGPYEETSKVIVRDLYDRFLLPSIIKNVDYVFVKSKLAREYAIAKGFSNPRVIGVGLDKDRFLEKQNNDNIPFKELIQSNKTLLYIGKLEERRNISFLLKLFQKVREADDSLYLILIGIGEKSDTKRYFELAESLSIIDFIIYIPKVDQENLKFYYEQSEIFLFPTKYEIFGMVLLESLYFGTPIITSKNGGSDLLIKSGENGIIIEDFDINLWKDAIEDVIFNPSFKEKIISNGKKSIKHKFNWDAISENLLPFFDK